MIYPSDGSYTDKWVSRKVRGKWERTEYYLVGQMIDQYQYVVYLEGNKKYDAKWGYMAVETNLCEKPENVSIRLCAECERERATVSDFLCPRCREHNS